MQLMCFSPKLNLIIQVCNYEASKKIINLNMLLSKEPKILQRQRFLKLCISIKFNIVTHYFKATCNLNWNKNRRKFRHSNQTSIKSND